MAKVSKKEKVETLSAHTHTHTHGGICMEVGSLYMHALKSEKSLAGDGQQPLNTLALQVDASCSVVVVGEPCWRLNAHTRQKVKNFTTRLSKQGESERTHKWDMLMMTFECFEHFLFSFFIFYFFFSFIIFVVRLFLPQRLWVINIVASNASNA